VRRAERIGALIWVTALQFYVVEWLVARAWTSPTYRDRVNTISDLGAAGAPDHVAMNISFVALGVAIAVGGVLLGRSGRRGDGRSPRDGGLRDRCCR
jgi:hypothetical membrane protein